MKQQNTSAQRGPAHAGRWLARVLLVVGGAVAGTAAAWAISTASASADTVPATGQDAIVQQDDQATPATDAVLGASDDVLLGTAQLAGDTAGAAVRLGGDAPSADSVARSQQAANDVTGAVREFTGNAVLQPAHRILGSAEQITRKPQDAPRVIGQALTPPADFWNFLRPSGQTLIQLPTLSGLSSTHAGGQHTSVAPPVVTPQADPLPAGPVGPATVAMPQGHPAAHFDVRDEAGQRQHGDQPDRFPFAPVRSPLAPSGVPFTPGGSATGGHIDGPLLGVPANALTVADAHGLRAVRFGIRHTPVQPGSQPGVTPD
ncbi:hypothetical protein [Amycolatopsis sp. GM8]|uniref:hypothetical protein n=1 Tax=Amycolatopsis sp. GM8 TaxID=2896530 RepID=UPI001F390BE0|nr:hypothetical protein [Amycolatopsis sp. GM8]